MGTEVVPHDMAAFRALARARLAEFPRIAMPDAPGMRRAAVALCVVAEPGGSLSVLVIKRAYRGRNAGQWAIPGGRLEPGETAQQAALRELHEELGVRVDPADVLGLLDDFPAASGFAITPVVATLSGQADLRPSPDEVHSVHHVDLDRLAADDVPHWVHPEDAAPHTVPGAPDVPIGRPGLLQMRLGPRMTIHAPTGALLWQFREVVLLGRTATDARVADFLQPDWTHR
ncbi:CoA pyrophosphatase [Nocardia farcinica]|uniref:NUDIX hydrolase n=1 Tax=Nocardia farcinica TaxID=37329 RepID=UPI0018932160|nr:CoA pyrophosphatase [Nocardia farcinica]MBF6383647.1 CoA pyrophosphatase [Nocardia farcinica]MBF6417849.1 CoA pyrophosphatase [Nocardia farcinica]MBF6429326.1 CoA pyrophosphatase [Nocardia farcinica]MBF6499910.1 CoA pyrophosphatase [Nocardia farcinica]